MGVVVSFHRVLHVKDMPCCFQLPAQRCAERGVEACGELFCAISQT